MFTGALFIMMKNCKLQNGQQEGPSYGNFTGQNNMYNFLKDFIYSLSERGEAKEKKRERNIHVWLPLMCPQLGTQPATQACALTGN